jgi:hypothetical protein
LACARQNKIVWCPNAIDGTQKSPFLEHLMNTIKKLTPLGRARRQPTPEASSHRPTSLRSQYAAEYRSNHQL